MARSEPRGAASAVGGGRSKGGGRRGRPVVLACLDPPPPPRPAPSRRPRLPAPPLLLLLLLLLSPAFPRSSAAAAPAPEPDQPFRIPDGWSSVGRVAPSERISLTFALRQRNVERLSELVRRVSSPDSPDYGHFLSLAEVSALVSPSPLTLGSVDKCLATHGVRDCQRVSTLDFLQCSMPASTAERLFPGAQFHRYAKDARTVIRSPLPYLLDRELADHVDFVGGLHRFPAERKVVSRAWAMEKSPVGGQDGRSSFHLGVTPAVLRQRYNLTRVDAGNFSHNSQACAQVTLGPAAVPSRGGSTSSSPASQPPGEQKGPAAGGSLDPLCIQPLSSEATGWAAGEGGAAAGGWRWQRRAAEFDWPASCLPLPQAHKRPWCRRPLPLGGLLSPSCLGSDGWLEGRATKLHLLYSPYVTTVGGTAFRQPFLVGAEMADYISGGGFSNVFPMPDYQVTAVKRFLSTSPQLPPASYYNSTGRAYPDLAALSDNYWVVTNHIPMPWVSGTSASTPVVGGIIALINDWRFQRGLPALGFLNPALYRLQEGGNSTALYDVTHGCHLSCLDAAVQGQGFCAAPAWDPVTGWGTPNFPQLLRGLLG
ncbi:tripeptidyl-peptidase 1 isoform 3-T3 [Vipera latastei]